MKKTRSIYVLYVLSQIALAGLVLVVIAAGVISFIGDTTWGLPTFYRLENNVTLYGTTTAEIAFTEGFIEIQNNTLSGQSKVWIIGGMLVILACIAFGIYCFNRFIAGVYEGRAFADKTIGYLKKLAFALVAVYAALFIFTIGSHLFIGRLFDMSGYSTRIFSLEFFYNPYLFTALFLWVLAHIFQKAKELEDDQNLTI